jgi:hypothetical protein
MSGVKKAFIWIGILIPPVIFYATLARSLSDLPFADDYDTILGFLLQWRNRGWVEHIAQVFTFQHNDYRCMLENAIVGTQYTLLGHTNIRVLSIVGNLLVIPIFGVLYLIWKDCGRPLEYTLVAFVPVSWMLFQLQYEGTLDFATSGLQCIPVVLFALLTCYLAPKKSTAAFVGTLASLSLCIASYANGLFLVPIGAVIYIERREFKRLAAWCVVSGAACLLYFHKYNFAAEATNTHVNNNVLGLLQHFSPLYAAAFLGSVGTVRNPGPAILFAVVLAGIFLYATRDRLFSRRPSLYYSAMFIVITGLAVSGLRSSFGISQALDSRYRINSTVLMILLYLYVADKLYEIRLPRLMLRTGATVVGMMLMGFNLASNYAGGKFLVARRDALEAEMVRWQRHDQRSAFSPSFLNNYSVENKRFQSHLNDGLYDPIEPFLSNAVREGIYTVPELAEQSESSRLGPPDDEARIRR